MHWTLTHSFIGSCGTFTFTDKWKYLGALIGPGAGDLFFQDGLATFCARVRDIKRMGVGLTVTLRLYNQQAVSVLSFLLNSTLFNYIQIQQINKNDSMI